MPDGLWPISPSRKRDSGFTGRKIGRQNLIYCLTGFFDRLSYGIIATEWLLYHRIFIFCR